MTTDQDMARIVRTWLEPGLTTLTDDVLDGVMDRLPATPQRRRWPARRINDMNPIAKYAIAAAAVVVIAFVGLNFVGTSGTGQPGGQPPVIPSPSPSAAPSASAVPFAPSTGAIEPGRYRWSAQGGEATFDLPSGWRGVAADSIGKNVGTAADITLMHNLPGSTYEVTHVYTDACDSENALEPVGDTVDDLVAALQAQKNVDVEVNDVTAGSVSGKWIAIEQPASLEDRSGCRYGAEGPLQIWADEAETGFLALAPGFRAAVYVFDVDGERFVFATTYGPETSDATVAEVDQIIESMRFSPR